MDGQVGRRQDCEVKKNEERGIRDAGDYFRRWLGHIATHPSRHHCPRLKGVDVNVSRLPVPG